MKTLIFVFAFLLQIVSVWAEMPETRYIETTGRTRTSFIVRETGLAQGGLMISVASDREVHVFVLDRNYATQAWFFTNQTNAFVVTRAANTLHLLKGRVTNRVFPIDENPWYQFVEASFRPWLRSQRAQTGPFWIIQPATLDLHRMVAFREGTETRTISGRRGDFMRVRMTLPDIGAAFWRALFWFEPNGRFVRYEGVRGMPGTPKSTLEIQWE